MFDDEVNIICDKCKWSLVLRRGTLLQMAVLIGSGEAVLPCQNPLCDNNIPLVIEEHKNERL